LSKSTGGCENVCFQIANERGSRERSKERHWEPKSKIMYPKKPTM